MASGKNKKSLLDIEEEKDHDYFVAGTVGFYQAQLKNPGKYWKFWFYILYDDKTIEYIKDVYRSTTKTI